MHQRSSGTYRQKRTEVGEVGWRSSMPSEETTIKNEPRQPRPTSVITLGCKYKKRIDTSVTSPFTASGLHGLAAENVARLWMLGINRPKSMDDSRSRFGRFRGSAPGVGIGTGCRYRLFCISLLWFSILLMIAVLNETEAPATVSTVECRTCTVRVTYLASAVRNDRNRTR